MAGVAAATVLWGLGPAIPPAAAATDGGTDVSRVVTLDPPADALVVDVAGGDAQLTVRVSTGHALEVPGYQGERWLRIGVDGTVEQNAAAPTTYVNANADGGVPVPADATVDADARWEVVGDGGEWAWHDHRIHDMGAMADRGPGPLATWEVPIVLDGQPVVVAGTLDRLASPSPLVPLALIVAVGGAVWAAVRHRRVTAVGAPVAVSGLLTAAVASAALVEEATAIGGSVSWTTVAAIVLGLDAAGLCLVAVRLRRRVPVGSDAGSEPATETMPDPSSPRPATGDPTEGPAQASAPVQGRLLMLAAAQVAVALGLQAASFTQPVLVTTLPTIVDTVALAIAAGCLAGATASLVGSGLGAADQPAPTPVI